MLPVVQDFLRDPRVLSPFLDESPTASPIVEPTVAVEATPTPVPFIPTPEPLPSPWQPDQWLQTTGWTADFHTPFLVLFLCIAVAAAVAYFYLAQRRWRGHTLNERLAGRMGTILTALASVGLLLLLFALVRLPLLSFPLWLIMTMVALLTLVVYAVYYYIAVYPLALARYVREQDRARYIPKPKTKGPAYTPPMRKKQQQQKQKQKRK